MPVYRCSTCERMISLSIIPGGNPVALADSDLWAVSWRGCPGCEVLYCEHCAPPDEPRCPVCGSDLAVPDENDFLRLYFGGPKAWFHPADPSQDAAENDSPSLE